MFNRTVAKSYIRILQDFTAAHLSKALLNWSTTYPAVSVTAERLLVSPVSTVDCERGSSRMNLIKRDVRNKLVINTLENLMSQSA
jgi:hypothetical protein